MRIPSEMKADYQGEVRKMNYTFFMRNQFISNLVLDSLKFKKF